jgi:hypothetical protein
MGDHPARDRRDPAARVVPAHGGRGQILGIFLLTLNLVAQLFFLPVYPFWSIIVMVIDGFAIYGLTVYGEHFGGP